jgi:bifunctional DNase/RNase
MWKNEPHQIRKRECVMVQCNNCDKQPVIHVTRAQGNLATGEEHYCQLCWEKITPRPFLMPEAPPANLAMVHGEVPVEVDSLIISEIIDHQTLIFKEVGGVRGLAFIAGIFEITVIDRKLKKLPSPRPLTHDSWLNTIVALGAKVHSACIHNLKDHVYYARLRLDRGTEVFDIDLRPSDALALALTAGVPLLFDAKLWAACSASIAPI